MCGPHPLRWCDDSGRALTVSSTNPLGWVPPFSSKPVPLMCRELAASRETDPEAPAKLQQQVGPPAPKPYIPLAPLS